MRHVAWILAVAGVTYLVFVGGTATGLEHWPIRLIGEFLLFAVTAAWLNLGLFRDRLRPVSQQFAAIASLILLFAIGTYESTNQRISAEYFAYVVLLVPLYLLLVWSLTFEQARRRLVVLVSCLCLAIALGYVFVVSVRWIEWWTLVGFPSAPPLRPAYESLFLGNPSMPGTLAILFLSATIAAHERARRSRLVALALLVIAVVVLTGSRGTLAAAAAAALPLLVRPTLTGLRRLRSNEVALRPRQLAAVLAGLAGFSVLVLPAALARVSEGGGADVRLSYAASSVRMIATHPVWGVGPGLWGPLRATYTGASDYDYYLPQAHNIVLQTLAEFGIVGLLAGAVVILLTVRFLRAGLRSEDPGVRRFALAAAFNLAFVGIQEFVNPFATQPAVLFAMLLPLAWVDGLTSHRAARLSRPATALLLGGIVVAGGFLISIEGVGLKNVLALRLNHFEDPAAISLSQGTTLSDPQLPVYRLNAGLIAAQAGELSGARLLFAAVTASDDFPAAWLDLAAVDVKLGNSAEAHAALERAMRLGRQDPGIAFAAGHLYLAIGDRPAAIGAFQFAILHAAPIANRQYWDVNGGAPLQNASVEAALGAFSADEELRFEIALYSSDWHRAADQIDRLPAQHRQVARAAIATFQGQAEALQALLTMARQAPSDQFVVGWAARAARQLGDSLHADSLQRWLTLLDPVAADTYGRDISICYGDDDRTAVRGTNASAYGPMLYRRDTRRNLLVDWLPSLCYEHVART
jgi:hypothetical protein